MHRQCRSDKGANFESKVIKKLCSIEGVLKTRTTPYHSMRNGVVERYNQTLLNMIGTLKERQKSDWKTFVPALTHAYNSTNMNVPDSLFSTSCLVAIPVLPLMPY